MASKTVLVIDADSQTEQLITSTLESEGYLVFSVPGGDIGAEMAQKVSPSLIFINPAETGLDICGTIHEFESLKKVPIILLASPSGAIDPGSASTYGVTDFLEVPFSSGELLEKTAKALDLKAPIVLHVREKDRSADIGWHETSAGTKEVPSILESVEREPDSAEIFGMAELDEEISPAGGPDNIEAPDYSYDAGDSGSSEKEIRPGKKKNKFIIAVAAIVIVIAGTAGFLFYSGLIPGIGPQKAVPVKTLKAAAKPKTVVPTPVAEAPAPSSEKQKEQPVADIKAAAAPQQAASSPSSPPKKETTTPSKSASSANVPAAKSPGKKVYSVQIGVFKSESNAAALTKQFTGKGYDAFMIKSAANNKETLYRVLVGKSEDRKESAKLAAKMRDKEKIKAVIYTE